MMEYRVLLAVMIVGVILASVIPMTSTASTVRRKDTRETGIMNQNKVYHHARKRDLSDQEMATKLGNFDVDKAVRSRRDESSVEIKQHVLKAEADAIAAAEESSAAEKHAIDAIAETKEVEQEITTFEENDAGELVRVPDKESYGRHDHNSQLTDGFQGLESSGSKGHGREHGTHDFHDLIQGLETRGDKGHGHETSDLGDIIHGLEQKSDNGHGHGHETDHNAHISDEMHDHESRGGGGHGGHGHKTDHNAHFSDELHDHESRGGGGHSGHGHATDHNAHSSDEIHDHEPRGGGGHGEHGHGTAHNAHISDEIHYQESRGGGGHEHETDQNSHVLDDTRHENSGGGGYENDEISHFHEQRFDLHRTGETGHGHEKSDSENDSDMVHVADIEHLPKGEHRHGFKSGKDDMVHVADIEHFSENSHGHGHSSSDLQEQSISSDHIFGENLDDQGQGEPGELGAGSVESSGHHEDVETPLHTLLTQSKDLAKETQLVFQVIARREDFLVKEMESFKKALQDAIQILQETAKENKQRFKRWDSGSAEPYKACVYVTPGEGPKPQPRSEYTPPERYVQEQQYFPPPVPEVAPMPPPPPAPSPEPEPVVAAQSQPQGDDIDLSSVYWLKLPQNEDESSVDKVQRVLGEVRASGRDILLIPVLKGFTDVNDLARGFLRSVRVNPAAVQSANKNSRRRKFRLRIRRLL